MNYLWILKEDKYEFENSAKASGLRLTFYNNIKRISRYKIL